MNYTQKDKMYGHLIISLGFFLLASLLFVPFSFGQAKQTTGVPVHLPDGVIPPPDEAHASHEIGTCGSKHYEPRLEFCDTRDNTVYRYVKIGTQTWMAENLNFGKMIPGSADQTGPGQKYCLHDNEKKCAALYQWAQAVGHDSSYNSMIANLKGKVQGVCPSGWHVPGSAEWDTLISFVDKEQGKENEAISLMYQSYDDDFKWKTNTDPDNMIPTKDLYGFAIVSTGQRVLKGTCPVGAPNDSWFCNAHDAAMFWTSDDGLGNTDPKTAVNITFTEDIPQISNSAKRISQMNRDPSKLTNAEKAEMQAMEEMMKKRAAEKSELQRTYKESQKYQGMAVRCVKDK